MWGSLDFNNLLKDPKQKTKFGVFPVDDRWHDKIKVFGVNKYSQLPVQDVVCFLNTPYADLCKSVD